MYDVVVLLDVVQYVVEYVMCFGVDGVSVMVEVGGGIKIVVCDGVVEIVSCDGYQLFDISVFCGGWCVVVFIVVFDVVLLCIVVEEVIVIVWWVDLDDDVGFVDVDMLVIDGFIFDFFVFLVFDVGVLFDMVLVVEVVVKV